MSRMEKMEKVKIGEAREIKIKLFENEKMISIEGEASASNVVMN